MILKRLLHPKKRLRKAQKYIHDDDHLFTHARTMTQTVLAGTKNISKHGNGEEFWQFREYTTEDDSRSIDWRQSGKSDHLYLRQQQDSKQPCTILWRDRSAGMDFQSQNAIYSKIEAANLLTLCLAMIIGATGERWSYNHKKNIKTPSALSSHLSTKKTSASPARPLPSTQKNAHKRYIHISDFLFDIKHIEESFKNLSQQQNTILLQVLDPDEITFPYQGRIIFKNPGNEEYLETLDANGLHDRYKERLNAHITAIKEQCKRQGWIYLLHTTDTPIESTLQRLIHLNEQKRGTH